MRTDLYTMPPHTVCRCDESAQRVWYFMGDGPVCYACFIAMENRGARSIGAGDRSAPDPRPGGILSHQTQDDRDGLAGLTQDLGL